MVGNRGTVRPLPSISDIAEVYKYSTEEDAIIIAQSEIACLDDVSLDGDIPDDISENGQDHSKDLFTGS